MTCWQVVQHLGPATDFYKKLALDCSGQQTAVDLFLLSSQYSDLSSLGKEILCLSVYINIFSIYIKSKLFNKEFSIFGGEKRELDRWYLWKLPVNFKALFNIKCYRFVFKIQFSYHSAQQKNYIFYRCLCFSGLYSILILTVLVISLWFRFLHNIESILLLDK